MMPSSASSGVRDAPAPVVPGWERMRVRVTSRSYVAGDPYGLKGAPDLVMLAGISGGEAALASLEANAMNAPAVRAPAPPFKKTLRSSNPFPAALGAALKGRSWRRGRIAILPSRRSAREGSRAAQTGQGALGRPYSPVVYSDDHEGAPSGHRAAGIGTRVTRRRATRCGGRESPHRRIA